MTAAVWTVSEQPAEKKLTAARERNGVNDTRIAKLCAGYPAAKMIKRPSESGTGESLGLRNKRSKHFSELESGRKLRSVQTLSKFQHMNLSVFFKLPR